MITLSAERLHWLRDDGVDDPKDLCAHSPVTCEIDGEVIAHAEDGDWTVSASAIFLLRALGRDHTKDSMVGDQLFPCCGHSIYDVGEPEVLISGCPAGIDFEIRHQRDTYQLTMEDGRIIEVPKDAWRDAVLSYSDQVMEFYEKSMPKKSVDEDGAKAFAAMMSEWRGLRVKHASVEQEG